MVEKPADYPQTIKHRSFSDLLLWLALLPFILGSLICFGQLALIISPPSLISDTTSRLTVSYGPWKYDLIPAINIAALIGDIQKERAASGEGENQGVIVPGVYWEPPTPTAGNIFAATATPEIVKTNTPQPPIPTRTNTPIPTQTKAPSTTTPTLPPTRTVTRTQPPLPTWTHTVQPPVPTFTRRPPTITPTATVTPTVAAPTAPTPIIPTSVDWTPTPKHVPVWPFVNNNGASEKVENGCLAYFGYQNDNQQAVDIQIGPRNIISDDSAIVSPGLPTHFQVGQQSGAFQVVWNSGGPIIWTLDGRSAAASWCNP